LAGLATAQSAPVFARIADRADEEDVLVRIHNQPLHLMLDHDEERER